jgi:hypothetical protein
MRLTTEELGDVDDVTANDVERVLGDDAFGGFAILAKSDDVYMQAGNQWSADAACEVFVQKYGSDPWVLEYRDGKHFAADRNVTLDEVKRAFLSYLRGDPTWRTAFTWSEIDV